MLLGRSYTPWKILLSGLLGSISSITTGTNAIMLSTTTSRIAVGQLKSTADKRANLLSVAKCAGQAKRDGASVLFLPENLGFLGSSVGETLQQAEPPMGDTTQNDDDFSQVLKEVISLATNGADPLASTSQSTPSSSSNKIFVMHGLQIIARESGLWLTGTIHTAGAPLSPQGQPRVYNTHVVLDNQGELRAAYHKIHLFDVDIPGKITIQESATTAPGNQVVLCDSPAGRLGLSTCYDLRFPELYMELVKRGAQLILVPSAFTVPTGTAHWHTLLRARAIESQCFVVAAAQVGVHNAKRESYGHSLVIDPWGTILADAGGVDEPKDSPPCIVCCDIDLSLIESTRQKMPVQQHREQSHFS